MKTFRNLGLDERFAEVIHFSGDPYEWVAVLYAGQRTPTDSRALNSQAQQRRRRMSKLAAGAGRLTAYEALLVNDACDGMFLNPDEVIVCQHTIKKTEQHRGRLYR